MLIMHNNVCEQLTTTDRAVVVIAIVNGNAVGEASMSRQVLPLTFTRAGVEETVADHWYFNRLVVKPAYRGRGLSKRLLTALTAQCAARELVLLCDVNPYGDLDHDQLVDLYHRFGFVDVQLNEYGHTWTTLLLDKRKGTS